MNFSVASFIGLRYGGARSKNQMVSFLSSISILGLVVGVALLLTVLSIMNGFDRALREKILGLVPQAAIYKHQGILNWRDLIRELPNRDGIQGAAPFIQLNGIASFGSHAEPLLLYGIDSSFEAKVSLIEEYIPEQQLQQLAGEEPTIILGQGIAERLSLQASDRLMLIAPSSKAADRRTAAVEYFRVISVFQSNTELDNSLALTGLYHAAKLAGLGDRVSGIRLKLNDLFQAPTIVYQELVKLGPGYYGSNWTRTHGNLYHAIQMSKRMVSLLVSLIVAIAAFNVVSTLVMIVVDKQGDIAILRTMGSSSKQIMWIFIIHGLVIGVVGALLGVVSGTALAFILQDFVYWLENLLGFQFLKSDVYPLTYLPTEVRLGDVLGVFFAAVLMSLLATLYPAWRASRVQPAEALRYE